MPELFEARDSRLFRFFAIGWILLSLIALAITAWILSDLQQEQQIVSRIIRHLPQSDQAAAGELSSDINLQRRLSALLVVNLIGTAIAFAFVVRAYYSSEQRLRDARVLATDIRASIDAAIITTDRAGKVTSINPQGRELLDISEECLGRHLHEISGHHELLESICKEVLASQRSLRNRDYTVTTESHRRTLRAGCALLRNQKHEEIGTVIHITDVTEKTLMEQRLRRMERYMGLGSLAAGLQHEIRNPLSALTLHIQLLKEKVAENPNSDEIAEMLDVLHTETQRVNSVLEGFGNYASMKELGRGEVDIAYLIEKLTRLLRPQATQQNIEIVVDIPELQETTAIGQTLLADSVQLEQVLLNLALNAMSAMTTGGVMTFRVRTEGQWLQILVSDTGHGIPTDVQTKIFDPYFTTRQDGTGMGLALCDKIIRQHGGVIDFTTGSSGTEFRVALPMDNTE